MSKYTEKSKEYTMNYMKEKLDEIKFRVPKGKKSYYKAAAKNAGLSLSQFAVSSMDDRIARERLVPDSKALSSTAAPSATEQQDIPNQPVISSTAASGSTTSKPRKPFTKEAAEQIDTNKLLNDFRYQLDIGLAYGNDVLTKLLNEARQQSVE